MSLQIVYIALLCSVTTGGTKADKYECLKTKGSTCNVGPLSTGDSDCRDCCTTEDGIVHFKPDSLTVGVSYQRTATAILTAQWDYDDQPNLSFGMFVINIILLHNRGSNPGERYTSNKYCYYVNKNVTKFVAQLDNYFEKTYYVEDLVNITVELGTDNKLSTGLTVDRNTHCWSVMGNRSLDVCGVQVPSPPVNVSAVLSVDCSTSQSTFTVKWSPPLYNNTPILYYYTQVFGENNIPTFTNITKNTSYVSTELTMSKGYVKVRAGIKGFDCLNCIVKHVDGVKVSFGPSSRVDITEVGSSCPTQTAATTTTTPVMYIVVTSSVISGILVVAIVVALVVCVIICKYKKRVVISEYEDSSVDDVNSSLLPSLLPSPGSVFIVASTVEDKEMQYKLRYLVHDLADNGIESVYYDYERTSHGPESPAALGISQWVELQFQKCDLVLFAFTKRFLEEWRRESTDQLSPVVWSSRHVLDGLLPHQGNISKFGVVLMGDDCTIPPGLKRFQVFRLFNGDSPTIHSEQLIRYILETPPYAPPRVPMSNGKPLSV